MSVTEYFYPSSFSQAGGATTFKDLGNIANESTSSYAVTTSATSQTNILFCEDFNVSVPTNAEISEAVLEVGYQKTNFDAKKPFDGILYSGVSYTSDGYEFSNSITLKDNMTVSTFNVDLNKINRLRFNCMAYAPIHYNNTISMGTPSPNYQTKGYVRIIYVRIKITYTLPKYSLSVKRADHHNAIGQETVFSVNISNLNKTNHKNIVNIALPNGVTYTGSSNNVSIRGNILTWTPNINSKLLTASLAPKFRILTTGEKTFTITESYGVTDTSKTITFEAVSGIDDTTTMEEQFIQEVAPIVITEESVDLSNIQETAYVNVGDVLDLKIVVDNTILSKLVNITMIGANENIESIPIIPKSSFSESGESILSINTAQIGVTHLQVQYTLNEEGINNTYLAQKYTLQIMPSQLTYPFLNIIQLSQEECARLGNLVNYTVQTYLRINTSEEEVADWRKNYRLGVFAPVELEEPLNELEIFQHVEEWSHALANVNEFESVTTEFTYHDGMPVYIVITGDYVEGNPQENSIDYTNPCIVESDVYVHFEETGNYPLPINNSFSTTQVCNLTIHSFEAGTPFILSDFGLDDEFGTNDNMAITGLQLDLDVNYSDELSLSGKLKSPTGESGERSVILNQINNDSSTSVHLGGPRDTWGFQINELTNLEDWEMELQFNNVFSNSTNEGSVSFNNATLTIYYNTINDAVVTMKVEGADTRYYGLFLQDVEIPGGINTETKYLEIEGTDSHDSYRQNIDRKEIKLQMRLDSCDIYDSTELLRNVVKLFTNKRDELNRPIPKRIWFSHYPDLYFEFLLEDAIENSFTDDKVEITLVIPSGTAYSLEDTVTNVTGANISIAKVNPTIVFIPISDNVEIVENNSEQKFNITYPNWNSGQLVEIDCENRQVWLKTSEDDINPKEISSYVDFNSDWFLLHEEYNFSCTNCIIQTVTFTERW